MEKYRVIGGYHDGEWWACSKPAIRLEENHYNDFSIPSLDDALTFHDYEKQEFGFNYDFGKPLKSIYVWVPSGQTIRETLVKLVDGYKQENIGGGL